MTICARQSPRAHVNTELRVAWRQGLQEGLAKKPDEVVPYKILPFAVEAVKKVARSRLQLFNANRLVTS
jgi:fructose/tagatose bisphosphate aldolase